MSYITLFILIKVLLLLFNLNLGLLRFLGALMLQEHLAFHSIKTHRIKPRGVYKVTLTILLLNQVILR
jgi:hypothetical protein